MDDAGGGRRGQRPVLTTAARHAIERAYGLSLATARDLGGSANLNLLAESAAGPVAVRIYRTHVNHSRVAAVQAARGRLVARGVPAAHSVPTLGGDVVLRTGLNVIEVERFVASNAVMDSLERVAVGLPVLARLHDSLAGADLGAESRKPAFTNYVPPGELIARTRLGTARIRSWNPTAVELAMADAADRLADTATDANESFANLPSQLVHGDYWDNNVLFRGSELVLVTDLDFMGHRLRIDDVALTLYFATYPSHRPTAPLTIRVLADLLDAYDGGSDRRLSVVERAAMPIALARQPLWSVGAWVAQLDNVDVARRHLHGHLAALEQGLAILDDLDRWQHAFTDAGSDPAARRLRPDAAVAPTAEPETADRRRPQR